MGVLFENGAEINAVESSSQDEEYDWMEPEKLQFGHGVEPWKTGD
jgi:hypothetical protein